MSQQTPTTKTPSDYLAFAMTYTGEQATPTANIPSPVAALAQTTSTVANTSLRKRKPATVTRPAENIFPATHPFNLSLAGKSATPVQLQQTAAVTTPKAQSTAPIISGTPANTQNPAPIISGTPANTQTPAPVIQTQASGSMMGKLLSGAYSWGVYALSHVGIKTAVGAAGTAVGYMLTESYAGPLVGAAVGALLPIATSAAMRAIKGTPAEPVKRADYVELTKKAIKTDAGLDDADMAKLDLGAWSTKMQAASHDYKTSLINALKVLKAANLLNPDNAATLLKTPTSPLGLANALIKQQIAFVTPEARAAIIASTNPEATAYTIRLLLTAQIFDKNNNIQAVQTLDPVLLANVVHSLSINGLLNADTFNMAKNSPNLKDLADSLVHLEQNGFLQPELVSAAKPASLIGGLFGATGIPQQTVGVLENLTGIGTPKNGECLLAVLQSPDPLMLSSAFVILKHSKLFETRNYFDAVKASPNSIGVASALMELKKAPFEKSNEDYEHVMAHPNPGALAQVLKEMRELTEAGAKYQAEPSTAVPRPIVRPLLDADCFHNVLLQYPNDLGQLAKGLSVLRQAGLTNQEPIITVMVSENPLALATIFQKMSELSLLTRGNHEHASLLEGFNEIADVALAIKIAISSGYLTSSVEQRTEMNSRLEGILKDANPLKKAKEEAKAIETIKAQQQATLAAQQEAAKQLAAIARPVPIVPVVPVKSAEEIRQQKEQEIIDARTALTRGGLTAQQYVNATQNARHPMVMADSLIRLHTREKLSEKALASLIAADKVATNGQAVYFAANELAFAD